MKRIATATLVALLSLTTMAVAAPPVAQSVPVRVAAVSVSDAMRIHYRRVTIEGVSVFYREAGDPAKPTLLLLHGFPTSSHMFRDLIPQLANDYHIVAPDYPGFGNSDAPTVDKFAYTFDHLTQIVDQFTQKVGISKYAIYVQDYGAPIGFRLAVAHPERITAIISQNGNAYDEGLTPFWKPLQDAFWKNPSDANAKPLLGLLGEEGTRFQYETGVRDKTDISPDAWRVPVAELARPQSRAIQLALFYDYRKNPPLYASWHEYLRKNQPPLLAVWGKNDPIFGEAGATAFKRDLPNAEVHLLDTGHFALEEDSVAIAGYIRDFLGRSVPSGQATSANPVEQKVHDFYSDLSKGDLNAALSLVSPDIHWTASAGFPVIGGEYDGVDAVRKQVFGRLIAGWKSFVVTPDRFYQDGDTVLVTGHYRGTFKDGSPALNAAFVHVWESKNGVLVRFTHTSDTATVRDAMH